MWKPWEGGLGLGLGPFSSEPNEAQDLADVRTRQVLDQLRGKGKTMKVRVKVPFWAGHVRLTPGIHDVPEFLVREALDTKPELVELADATPAAKPKPDPVTAEPDPVDREDDIPGAPPAPMATDRQVDGAGVVKKKRGRKKKTTTRKG